MMDCWWCEFIEVNAKETEMRMVALAAVARMGLRQALSELCADHQLVYARVAAQFNLHIAANDDR
jgi:hypothetical protein